LKSLGTKNCKLEVFFEKPSAANDIYTVILFSTKMAEIRLKMVEYAQLKFDHLFWSNFVQFGRNLIHGWFVCADSGDIRPVWKHFDEF
jgi:hypothetical protein